MPNSNPDAIGHFLRKLSLKQYVGGNTYNAVALTVTGTNWTTTRAVFIPYRTFQTSLGGDEAFRLRLNITGDVSVGVTSMDLTISGITFKNVANSFQSLSAQSATSIRGFTIPNSGNISGKSTATETRWGFSGDIELDSKPTWMDT